MSKDKNASLVIKTFAFQKETACSLLILVSSRAGGISSPDSAAGICCAADEFKILQSYLLVGHNKGPGDYYSGRLSLLGS